MPYVVTRVAVTKPKRFGMAPGLTLPVASSVSDTSSSPDHPARGQLITHVLAGRSFALHVLFTESPEPTGPQHGLAPLIAVAAFDKSDICPVLVPVQRSATARRTDPTGVTHRPPFGFNRTVK
ncbi:hypothetical protein GCM10020218_032610 [Dactylosporangium vinaceum]